MTSIPKQPRRAAAARALRELQGLSIAPFAAIMIFVLLDAVSEISVTVRRLHDLDRSGWHYFLFVIPLYNIYLVPLARITDDFR